MAKRRFDLAISDDSAKVALTPSVLMFGSIGDGACNGCGYHKCDCDRSQEYALDDALPDGWRVSPCEGVQFRYEHVAGAIVRSSDDATSRWLWFSAEEVTGCFAKFINDTDASRATRAEAMAAALGFEIRGDGEWCQWVRNGMASGFGTRDAVVAGALAHDTGKRSRELLWAADIDIDYEAKP
jgi:hypothetical protein